MLNLTTAQKPSGALQILTPAHLTERLFTDSGFGSKDASQGWPGMVRHVKGKEREVGAEKGESPAPKEGRPAGAGPYGNRLCQNQGPGKGGGGGKAGSSLSPPTGDLPSPAFTLQ